MNKPEWRKELEEHKEEFEAHKTEFTAHTGTANIHREIFVSTATPTSSDGKDGDIWLVVAS